MSRPGNALQAVVVLLRTRRGVDLHAAALLLAGAVVAVPLGAMVAGALPEGPLLVVSGCSEPPRSSSRWCPVSPAGRAVRGRGSAPTRSPGAQVVLLVINLLALVSRGAPRLSPVGLAWTRPVGPGTVVGATRSFTPSRPAVSPAPSRKRWRAMTSSTCPPDHHGTLAGDLVVAPTRPRPGLVLVRVLGEVDLLTAGRLATVLRNACDTAADDRDTGPGAPDHEPSVVCDLDGVTFFGATGLDTVAAAHEAAADRGVRLVIVASCRTVCRPFRLTALDRRVTVTATHPAVGRASALPGTER